MACNYVGLPKEEIYSLINEAKNGDEGAKEELIKKNIGLVKSIALKYTVRGYELDDLLQIGCIGLLKAVERFDTGFNVMFSTYAVPLIIGEIKRFIRDDGKIKVSRKLKQDIREITAAQDEYYRTHGDYPKLSVLAEIVKMDKNDVLEVLDARDALTSMESLDNPEREGPAVESRIFNIHEGEEEKVNLIFLKQAIRDLGERERQVIVLRYFRDMTQTQVASKLGISQVQVSRIEKRVLLELRGKIEE